MYSTIDEITAEAMSIIPNATTTDRLVARQWAYRALTKIGPFKQSVTNDKIDVCDLSIEKPCDYQEAIDLVLYDTNDKEVNYVYRGRGKGVHSKQENENLIHLSEDAYHWHLSSDAEHVKYCLVRYWNLPIDKDGSLLIPEDYTLAIIYFIRFMHSLKRNENQSEIQQNRDMWLRERREARGKNKMPSMLEGEQIMKSWMSMLTTYQFDKF